MTDVPPYHKIEPQAQPWARWVTNGIQRVSGAVESLRTNLKSQGEVTAAQMNRLQLQIQYLQSLSDFTYNEYTDLPIDGFTDWYSYALCEVYIKSPTGLIEVGYGGSLNGGDGYFCYQVVGTGTANIYHSKESVLANPAKRVAVSGGASFAPSGWKTTLLQVPADTQLAVQLWVNADSPFTTFFGGSLYARVSPGRFSGLNTI